MSNRDVVTFEQYLTLRKVMADIVWYRQSDRIDELSVQVKKNSTQDIHLHNNSEKTIVALIERDHEATISEVMPAIANSSAISQKSIDSIKIWADMCFYRNNPKAFELLLSSSFNDGVNIKLGPFEFNSNDVSDKEALLGDDIRRVLLYPKVDCSEDGQDKAFIPPSNATTDSFHTAYRSLAAINDFDATVVYDILKLQAAEYAYSKKLGPDPHKWESELYSYYACRDFDEDNLMKVVDGDMATAKQPEDNCLATRVSKLSYSIVSQPDDIRFKNEFYRELFDTIVQTGEIPPAVTFKSTGRRETLRSFVSAHDINDLFPVLDAAYFIYRHADERTNFNVKRRICDRFAAKQEALMMGRITATNIEVLDDAFGERDIDENDIPLELQ